MLAVLLLFQHYGGKQPMLAAAPSVPFQSDPDAGRRRMTVTPSLTTSPRQDVRTPSTQSDELDQDEIGRIEKGAPDGKGFEGMHAPKSWHTDSNELRHERDLIYRNVSIDIFPNEPELLQLKTHWFKPEIEVSTLRSRGARVSSFIKFTSWSIGGQLFQPRLVLGGKNDNTPLHQ